MATASLTAPLLATQPLVNAASLTTTKSAAKEFEAVFLSQMMSHMFEGVGNDPIFGGGAGEDLFRGLMVQEYGKQMAKGQGIGISDQLQKMMLQMQQR